VTNQVVDMGLLQATAEPAREILEVDKIHVVADAGYFRTEDIAACQKAGLTPHVPRPQRGSSASHGFFRKDEFRYDPERDAYACPGGHELKQVPLWQAARNDEDRLHQQGRVRRRRRIQGGKTRWLNSTPTIQRWLDDLTHSTEAQCDGFAGSPPASGIRSDLLATHSPSQTGR
jgi:hypothetical protein